MFALKKFKANIGIGELVGF